MSGSKLRLGPLPQTDTVRVTVTISVELKAVLERYAALHGRTYGAPVDAMALIPHMLETFMARDRGFRKTARAKAGLGAVDIVQDVEQSGVTEDTGRRSAD